MMREIKFRAKCSMNNEWIYGDLMTYNKEYEILDDDGGYLPINIETLGQFTGLHDKNGTEIYEGDIVDYYGPCKVEFKNGTFGYIPCNLESVHEDDKYFKSFFNNEECEYYEDFQNSSMKRFKVIGNIYDNKELLDV